MKENMLPKKTLFLWQIRFAIIGILLSVICSFLCFFSLRFLILVGLIAFVFSMLIVWYLPRYFKSYEIIFNRNVITINCGVLIQTSHIMPFSRMIYAQSFATPIAKALRLSAISLKAARSTLLIPEIDEADVEEFLKAISKEDGI